MEFEGSLETMGMDSFEINEKEYRQYVKNWIAGIDDEIRFWDAYFRKKSYSLK